MADRTVVIASGSRGYRSPMSAYPDGLIDGVLALSRLIVAEEGLDDTLHRVTEIACRTITGCDTASITLERNGRLVTAAHVGDSAPYLDRAQYMSGSGPAVEAFQSNQLVVVEPPNLAEDRWPAFVGAADDHGIVTSMSVPLLIRDTNMGVLNIYATKPGAFTEAVRELASLYAEQAAVAIANAEVYWRTYALTKNLQVALETRDIIGQAKGILMWQHRISADEAFDRLRHCSQRLNIKLRDVADHVVFAGSLPERVVASD